LDQNRPNPFSHSTAITYHLSADGRPRTAVSLAVYDLSGRMIETLVDESLPTSYFLLPTSVVWGGKDEKGREVASGIYFYRLTAGSLVETKSMTLIRR